MQLSSFSDAQVLQRLLPPNACSFRNVSERGLTLYLAISASQILWSSDNLSDASRVAEVLSSQSLIGDSCCVKFLYCSSKASTSFCNERAKQNFKAIGHRWGSHFLVCTNTNKVFVKARSWDCTWHENTKPPNSHHPHQSGLNAVCDDECRRCFLHEICVGNIASIYYGVSYTLQHQTIRSCKNLRQPSEAVLKLPSERKRRRNNASTGQRIIALQRTVRSLTFMSRILCSMFSVKSANLSLMSLT